MNQNREKFEKVAVFGAGISGLTTAYFLNKYGVEVEVFEESSRVGGLISTLETPCGPVETAANGFLASLTLEQMALDLGIALETPQRESRRRYFFYDKLTRWPLSLKGTVRLILGLLKMCFVRQAPLALEPLKVWAERTLGPEFFLRILSVALNGIYAGDASKMSATLVVGRFFDRRLQSKVRRGRLRGTVAPAGGMGALIRQLRRRLEERGVILHLNHTPPVDTERLTVIATDVRGASRLLQTVAPDAAHTLSRVETLPLVSATLFFSPTKNSMRPKGFGVLFAHGVALGVLLNDWIFAGRTKNFSETWILGGAHRRDVVKLSDEQIVDEILREREKVFLERQRPLEARITRWPEALPHYTVEWERELSDLQLPEGIYLVGNYLGRIGLTQIVELARERAKIIAAKWGERRGS